MPGSTPIYALPYDSLTDPPDGADMGEDLALAVEAELARIDADLPLRWPVANIAAATIVIDAAENAPTSGAVSWGKTLPGTVYAFAVGVTGVPGSRVVEVTVASITSTGCVAWVYRELTGNVTIYALGIGV